MVATRGTAKPFTYTDDKGNLTGYDVEILKEVERRDPSLHFEFKAMAVDAAIVAMNSKQVDAIANQMRRNPAREGKYLYTNVPNNYTARKLVVKEGRTDIKSLDDLKGKKVALTAILSSAISSTISIRKMAMPLRPFTVIRDLQKT